MDTMTHHQSQAQQVQDMGDSAANTAQGAIRSTQRTADQALDRLSKKVDELRSQAGPMMNRVSAQAEDAARRGMEAMRDTSQQLRERAQQACDMTVAYVKDEPIKAMLIAAATGRRPDGPDQHARRPFARLSRVDRTSRTSTP